MPPQQQFITRPPAEIFGRHPGYGFAGVGVNTAIGNFTQASADLTFTSSLLGLLDWTRTYNPLSGTAGLTGPGWTKAFSSHLATGDQVTFFGDDGRVLPFVPASGGGFTTPQDLDAELTRNADGSFTLTYLSGLVWSFDSTGRLTSRSLEGQTVTFNYDANGLLTGAAHSLGPQLTFSHNAAGQVISATASDFIGGSSTYVYVWGFLNPAGHIYFASESSVPREVEEKVYQENELPFPLRYLIPNPAPNPGPAPAPGPEPGPEPNPGPVPGPAPIPVPDM